MVGQQKADSEINMDHQEIIDDMIDDKDAEAPGVELPATDVIDCDYKIQKMMPLSHMSLKQTFPLLCCCCSGKGDEEDPLREKKEQEKLELIERRDRRLTNIIKQYKGKYLGSSYVEDAKNFDEDVETA